MPPTAKAAAEPEPPENEVPEGLPLSAEGGVSPATKPSSETRQRVISAAIVMAVFLGALFFARVVFTLLVLALIVAATFELVRLLERIQPALREINAGAAALGVATLCWLCAVQGRPEYLGWVVGVGLMLAQLLALLRSRPSAPGALASPAQHHAAISSSALFAGTAAALPLALLLHLYLHFSPPGGGMLGARLVLLLLIPIWINDTAAFFGGRKFGKTKLAPHISPGKSVEGFFFGLVGGVLASVGVWWLLLGDIHTVFGSNQAVLIGIVVGLLGPAGDLAESAMKREAKVKDSGSFLPGHGGVLDRVDSILFPAIVFYAICITAIPQGYGLVVD